ncbi:MAG TPA: NIPSNAP family protein [Pirellulales bacterium]|nr:NIPSNAP family protein [Pirellulales bacterium]
MIRPATLLGVILMSAASLSAAEPDPRVFEMRTYYAAPHKLEALHARFRDHTTKLFEKHGMTNIGYWVPLENPERKLIYVLAYPSREERENAWQAFGADPDWKRAKEASEVDGKLVDKVEIKFLKATDYSPEIKPSHADERVFELRTYTTTPGNLDALNSRFRDHTVALFKKHGMTNIAYWNLLSDQEGAEDTLVYLLAHRSPQAAQESFAAFGADPAWKSALKDSETKAGGPLTVKGGVKSLFLKATDYSPIR